MKNTTDKRVTEARAKLVKQLDKALLSMGSLLHVIGNEGAHDDVKRWNAKQPRIQLKAKVAQRELTKLVKQCDNLEAL